MEDLSHVVAKSKSIQDLDDLTLLDIFDLLDMKTLILCTAVCKSWNRVIESFPKYMGKMKLKVDGIDLKQSSFTTLRKSYQHVQIGEGYGKLIFNVSSSFMSSLSDFAETLKDLKLQNIQVQRSSFIDCINALVNLKELSFDSAKCVNDGIKYRKGMFSPPQLTSLILKNCEAASLMNALILLNIQSRLIEFSYSINMKQLYHSLIGQQSHLEHLIVTNAWQQNVEHLMEQLNGSRVHLNDLKSLVIFDKPDRISYFNTTITGNVHTPIFLTTHAHNLRELYLEDRLDLAILRTIASDMELETLSCKNLENIPKEKIAELKPNLHLKKLFTERAGRLNELSMIFPSVETLKTSFAFSEPMDVIGNFKSLVNLHLEDSSKFVDLPPQMASLKLVVVDLGQLSQLKMFLERNSNSIDTLGFMKFERFYNISQFTSNQILELLSKFKRVVFTSRKGSDLGFLHGFNTARYTGEVNIEASSTVIRKAQNDRSVTAETVSLLRFIPELKIRKLEKMFEMNLGTIKHGADPVDSDSD